MKDVLVVFYSRSGTTRRVAHAIADAGAWDIEELVDRRPRRGALGYLRACADAWLGHTTELLPIDRDPADYRIVVIGGPIWAGHVSPAVATYLEHERDRLPRLAFFLTCGGRGQEAVLSQMQQHARAEPLATLALTEWDVEHELDERVHSLVEHLRVMVERSHAFEEPHPAPPA